MVLHKEIEQAFKNRRVLKVITGLNNFNLQDVVLKVQAAEIGGATYVDIAANIDILREVKKISSIPICVSSIDIDELYACFKEGANILEIGNFDIFYNKGIYFNCEQIVDLTKELMCKAPSAAICVTIPHCISLKQQIILAKKLEMLGVAIIQTEGISSQCYSNSYLLNSIYNASAALSSTYAFSQNVNIPILSSSGLNTLTAPIAIALGASGVGIGSFFNSSKIIVNIAMDVHNIMYSVHNTRYYNSKLQDFVLKYFKYILQVTNLKSKKKVN